MSDNKQKKDFHDRTRINTSEPYEVKYWTRKWRISVQQLLGAIRATGSTGVKKVEQYLRGKGAI